MRHKLEEKGGSAVQSGVNRTTGRRCYPQRSILPAVGVILIAAGLLLLFLCIPGWAWAALAGVALIAVGYVLIRLGKSRR